MKHFWKRLIACALTVIMLLGVMPPEAYAAVGELVTRSAVENAALLEALREVYGDDAEAYLAVLEQYGLIDEDGNFVTDEKIVMDGVEYTLDEIEAILDDPDTDLSKVVEVDGTYLTLADLKTIVEIERYLAYVKATYFTQQDLTDEQIGSFYSLVNALADGEVMMLSSNGLNGVGPAGVDHGVTLTATAAGTAKENSTYTVTVKASASAVTNQAISFSWRAVSGSVNAAGSGDITMYPGDTKTLTVSVGAVKGKTKGSATFLLQLYGLTNALFSNGSASFEQKVTVSRNDSFRYTASKDFSLPTTEGNYYREYYRSDEDRTYTGGEIIAKNTTADQTASKKTVTFPALSAGQADGLSDGAYQATLKVNQLQATAVGQSFADILQNAIFNGSERKTDGKYKFTLDAESMIQGTLNFPQTASELISNQNVTATVNSPVAASASKTLAENGLSYEVGLGMAAAYYYRFDEYSGGDFTNNHFYFLPKLTSATGTLSVKEVTKNTTVSFSAPAGTYCAGQSVPITVEFAFPVKITSGMTITVNGDKTLTPVEAGTTGQVCTFLYPVTDASGGSITITGTNFLGKENANRVTGANSNGMTMSVDSASPLKVGGEAGGVVLESIDRTKTFTSYDLSVQLDDDNKPQLVVTVGLNQAKNSGGNKIYIDWLNAQLANGEITSLQVMTNQTGDNTYPFTIDPEEDGTAITAVIDLPYNQSEEAAALEVDFLLDGAVLMGRGLTTEVQGSVLVKPEHIAPILTVTPSGGTPYTYAPGDEVPLLYAQQDNTLALSFALSGSGYTWGNTRKVTYYEDDEGTLHNPDAHFAWKSSDLSVAAVAVDSEGRASVVPTGTAGEVTFTLTALNGAMADAESAGITMNFAVGSDPFLLIPESGRTVAIREEQDALISWTSNLCTKNGAAGTPTVFMVSLYSGSGHTDVPVWMKELTTDENNKTISSVTVPWKDVLEKIYKEGNRSATVVVTADFAGKTYGGTDAAAVIQMTSQPASVTLSAPAGGLYQTDGGSDSGKQITLTWTVPHLDTTPSGGGKFELYIAGGRLDKPIVENKVGDAVSWDKASGVYSYTLGIPAVKPTNDPTSYRDSYSITVKAKNSAESTWAYDSYVLYVYSDSALRLLLDGAAADGSHTMSNVDKIAELWGDGGKSGSEAIVALQRDIALKNVISINYGEYAWAELADQIAWKSSDSAVATVNYQQGTLYENIENFSYTSYRPSTDFILSGLQDGTTTITAQHVKTGIKDTVTVNVETLRNKLYLFQCYPKTTTTLTYQVYTSGAHTAAEEYVLKTNEKGEAAIYAPYGLAGDVYCKSEVTEEDENVTYLGTIYNRSLVSSEADSTKLQLYPVNTLQLRRAAQAEIYLKNPDGTPYKGSITFRGGVYRNGEYCLLDNVKFGLQNKDRKDWKIGSEKQTVETEEDGRLLVTMDLMQFKTSADQKDVQAGEKLYYIFQLDYGNGNETSHYPIMLRVDANLNLEDIAATGDSIVAWEKNNRNKATPFLSMQTIQYSQSASANVGDVRKSTGAVGPSTTFPSAWLTTTVMWWGDSEAMDDGRVNKVTLRDTNGKELPQQTSTRLTYPFSDVAFTENVTRLDASGMVSWGVDCYKKRNVNVELSKDGSALSQSLALPFSVVNMIGASQAEEASVLSSSLNEIKSSVDVDSGDEVKKMGVGDKMLQGGMELLAGDAKYDPEKNRDGFGVRLYATSDPTVFRALFCIGMGNMGSGGNVTGVYPEYTDTENMAFVNVDGAVGDMDNGDTGIMPNLMNIYDMAKGNYLSKAKAEGQQAAAGKGVRSINMDLGGYVEADIAYNNRTGQWECRPIGGGFHAGGGVNYTWNFNSIVGVVPVNISITLGATLELRLDLTTGTYYKVLGGTDSLKNAADETEFNEKLAESIYTEGTANDYLTSLRIFLYIRAFAGIGFDVSVVACKIGVFGQLNVDLNFKWLNRNYLKDANNISAVGPVNSRKNAAMAGQEPRFSGSTGIEFVFKFLFISYEKVFCSIGFEIDGQYGDWETIEEIWAANKTINGKAVSRMAMPNGQVLYAIDLGAQMESRDYVDACEQVWLGGAPSMSLFSLDENQSATLAKALQTGAYSYANPVLSDDGAVMFYLSDRGAGEYSDATDLTNTRVAVSAKSGGQFQKGVRFDSENNGVAVGYGDSGVKVAGSGNSYAAVWVRQMEDYTPADGDGTLSEGQQMLQMNSTEIIAATSTGGSDWTLKRLTDNSTPDLAPVVATNGSRTVVAWREVSSTSAADLTSFDQQDAIRFKVYEDGKWGESQTLYDGTGSDASVKGIEAAMLSDGTAAVVYTLDTNSRNDSSTDWETVMAIIPANETVTYADENTESQDTVRTFRLTTDTNLDENPQITTVKFDNDTERFVVAWHTERAAANSDETESDIRLAAMGADGVLYENMPESLSMATGGTGDTIGSNFRFAKNAGNIDSLSILWADTVSGEADETQHKDLASAVAAGYENTGHDVLKAVKFVKDGSSYTLSGTVEVAAMDKKTLIDHFDAYMSSGEIKSVILGTNYTQITERTVTISDGTKDEPATIIIANPVSGMYAATAEFTNRVEESAVMLEYEKLYPNSDIDVQFTIRNSGKEPITKLEITAGNQTVYTSDTLDSTAALNLLPNRDITVTAKFPTGEAIKNVDYVIKATFDGEEVSLPGTLYLDIPDVGVSKVETIKEAGGERTLRYSLYNALSAKLADTSDKWQVKVGFYADQGCTELLKDTGGQDLIRTITETNDLALIDGGGYSAEVTLPVAGYATAGDNTQEEIPGTGIPVYVKAWVEAPVNPSSRAVTYDTVSEYFQGNNTTSLTLDNLALRRNEDVTLQSTMDNSSDTTSVTVDVQYNKLTGTTSGNLIVTLLDADGQPLEKLQSYTQQDGLLKLSEEGTAEKTFTFSQKGADVKVEFSDLILGADSVELHHVSLTGASVTYDPTTKTYTATGAGLTSGILDVAPKDPAKATITLTGASYDANGTPVNNLRIGRNEWTITVTNGGSTETYQLVLNNTNPVIDPGRPGTGGGSGSSGYAVTVTKPEHGKVTASPTNANSGSIVTLTVMPDSGYVLDTLTVTDSQGNEIKLTGQGGGKYTFTMPSRAVTIKAAFSPLPGDVTKPCDGGADCPSRAFTDLGGVGTWYHEAVDYALRNNLMGGYGNGLFGPNNNLTRAQLAQILYNLEGRPAVSGSSPFTDAANGAWYSDAITWAAANGIVSGYGGGKFGPDDNVTREQLATILWRCSKSPAATNKELHFNDADEISGYALDAIRWAAGHGILNGFGDGRLGPKGLATRAQVAQMLKNFIENQEGNS